MASEFVGASELFLAAGPITLERALSCVRTKMRFEMATFSVLFIAASVVAGVYFLLLLGFSSRVPTPGFLFWL